MLHRTALAHAERSAYNSRDRAVAPISWDGCLSTWTFEREWLVVRLASVGGWVFGGDEESAVGWVRLSGADSMMAVF